MFKNHFIQRTFFTSYKNKFIVVLMLLCLMTTDDSWLNLTDQDLEDMLSKYSDPDSKETGELAGKNTVKSSVSAQCGSACYSSSRILCTLFFISRLTRICISVLNCSGGTKTGLEKAAGIETHRFESKISVPDITPFLCSSLRIDTRPPLPLRHLTN